jgi:hypothetical protein
MGGHATRWGAGAGQTAGAGRVLLAGPTTGGPRGVQP